MRTRAAESVACTPVPHAAVTPHVHTGSSMRTAARRWGKHTRRGRTFGSAVEPDVYCRNARSPSVHVSSTPSSPSGATPVSGSVVTHAMSGHRTGSAPNRLFSRSFMMLASFIWLYFVGHRKARGGAGGQLRRPRFWFEMFT